MSSQHPSPPGSRDESVSEHGLRRDAVGFRAALAVGTASAAPAYSMAAAIGLLVATVGFQAPAVFIIAFVPMVLIALAYRHMNRAEVDCGSTFAWVTRALGPWTGWVAGFVVVAASVIVVGLLAGTAARYAYLLVGWDAAAASTPAVVALGAGLIVLAAAICVRGVQTSVRTQSTLLIVQLAILALFAIVTLARVWAGDAPAGSVEPSASWFSPFAIDEISALTAGLLIAVFAYWGWDSALSVNEETRDRSDAPGRAAVWSTVVLLGGYALLATALLAWAGASALGAFADDTALSTTATQVLGTPLDSLVVLAVLSAALASTQITIMAPARIVLSMSRAGALPAAAGRVHERWRTPHVATVAIAAAAIAWYVGLTVISERFLADSLASLGLLIALYYGLMGVACLAYYRTRAFSSVRTFTAYAVAPLAGVALFAYILVRSISDLTGEAEGATMWLGVQAPLVIGGGVVLLGLVLATLRRLRGQSGGFFDRRPDSAPREDRLPPMRSAGMRPAGPPADRRTTDRRTVRSRVLGDQRSTSTTRDSNHD